MKTNPLKWCEHCQKTDHDDKECWSTRVVNYQTPIMPLFSYVETPPEFYKKLNLYPKE